VRIATKHPAGELAFTSRADRSDERVGRLARSGKALKLAPSIYAVGCSLPVEDVAAYHRNAIAAHIWPGGVLCGATALTGGRRAPEVYIATADRGRRSPLALPGTRLVPVDGPGALPGDGQVVGGLSIAGTARTLVENVHVTGRPPRHRAGTAAVEDAIDDLARAGGVTAISNVLAQLEVIAVSFDAAAVAAVRSRLVTLLGTTPAGLRPGGRLGARLAGEPYDQRRLDLFAGLAETLARHAPRVRYMDLDEADAAFEPFFEAYFSNYIEGTEFEIGEAAAIVMEGRIPQDRPADAHDVSATYGLIVDQADRAFRPDSYDELEARLIERHRTLMAARPEKRPGQWKEIANRAGSHVFVEPNLMAGTMRRGFEVFAEIEEPFARAVAVMALVTECHPFDDGNGRLSRLTGNAELSAAGQARIIVPTVFRDNYLAALNGFSNASDRGEALISVLDFAQKWTHRTPWSTYAAARASCDATNAFELPAIAEANNRHLRLP